MHAERKRTREFFWIGESDRNETTDETRAPRSALCQRTETEPVRKRGLHVEEAGGVKS